MMDKEHYVFHSHSFMYCGDEVDNYCSCGDLVDIAQIYLAADSCHTTDEESEGDGILR